MGVERWAAVAGADSSAVDFVPQSRIRYFRRKSGGGGGSEQVIWDRERRIDAVFGSGRNALI